VARASAGWREDRVVVILGIEHVQLAMPPGGETLAIAFYEGLLGIPHVPKPAPLLARGGCWFESDAVKLHLGVEEPFTPARKAHPALVVDDLDVVVDRLASGGHRATGAQRHGERRHCYVEDPFGNRLELMASR
jgi:catechol 2,3-dioxygenase-like lactoylglutathione lyase family enzyme